MHGLVLREVVILLLGQQRSTLLLCLPSEEVQLCADILAYHHCIVGVRRHDLFWLRKRGRIVNIVPFVAHFCILFFLLIFVRIILIDDDIFGIGNFFRRRKIIFGQNIFSSENLVPPGSLFLGCLGCLFGRGLARFLYRWQGDGSVMQFL